jgi:GAF domain-containing protein
MDIATAPASRTIPDLDWIRALYALGQKAADGAHPQQVRQAILEHLLYGFEARSGSIALIVEGTRDRLELAAGTDLPIRAIGSLLPRGAFAKVLATGRPRLVNGDATYTEWPSTAGAPPHSSGCTMCWPLRASGRTLGTIALYRDSPRYTVEDLDGGMAIADLVALVMANHRLHVERDNRILELSTLNATMQRINAMLEEAWTPAIPATGSISIDTAMTDVEASSTAIDVHAQTDSPLRTPRPTDDEEQHAA